MLRYSYLKLKKDSEALRAADPEVLAALAGQVMPNTGAEINALSDKFSAVAQLLRMNGVCKMTWRGRLKETERVLCRFLGDTKHDTVSFLDLGASDGVTTLEAVEALQRSLQTKIDGWLVDLNLRLYRYRYLGLTEYRSSAGEPILARVGSLGLKLDSGYEHVLTKRYLTRLGFLRSRLRSDGEILLVNPLTASDPRITVRSGNCLVSEPDFIDRFDAIRASNLLIPFYFAEDQIRGAIANLYRYLREDGVLVLSRNEPRGYGEIEIGSIWRKESQRFRRLEDFGGGAEVGALVDGFIGGEQEENLDAEMLSECESRSVS